MRSYLRGLSVRPTIPNSSSHSTTKMGVVRYAGTMTAEATDVGTRPQGHHLKKCSMSNDSPILSGIVMGEIPILTRGSQ